MRIDDNYKINTDGAGTILIFEEKRQREKGGKMVDFIFTDQWFYLNVEQALRKYLDLRIEQCSDVSEILAKIEETREFITNLYKKNGISI
jgi:hypothetical protein